MCTCEQRGTFFSAEPLHDCLIAVTHMQYLKMLIFVFSHMCVDVYDLYHLLPVGKTTGIHSRKKRCWLDRYFNSGIKQKWTCNSCVLHVEIDIHPCSQIRLRFQRKPKPSSIKLTGVRCLKKLMLGSKQPVSVIGPILYAAHEQRKSRHRKL